MNGQLLQQQQQQQQQQMANNASNAQVGNWPPNGSTPGGGQLPNGQLMPSNAEMQQSLANSNAPTPASNRLLHATLPQRTGSVNGVQSSPNPRNALANSPAGPQSAQLPQGMNGSPFMHQQGTSAYPALPQSSFYQAFETFWKGQGKQPVGRVVTIDGKDIFLHALHSEVLTVGTPRRV